MKHALFPLAELPPGTMRTATVDGVEVVVVHTPSGRVHALRDRCSHASASLSRGRLQPVVVGESVGAYEHSGAFMIRCPRHGYEYDLETGHCLADSGHRVRAYTVTIEDGTVTVDR